MLTIIAAALVILGFLGLLAVIKIGLAVSIILIVVGVLLFVAGEGRFVGRLRR